MVGVGVAESGGGGGGAAEPYYGEYYPPEQYFVPQEMCPHPQQHPQHPHMCTVHTEYGGMPVVTSGTMLQPLLPPVMDDSMRHYLVHHHPQLHATHPQHHQPPPHHHQPPHHYGPANGATGPQHYYGPGYPTHYHVPQHHMPHYQQPPPVYKDERTQRQYSKLKQKLDRKYNNNNRNNGTETNSGASTPSLSPRKEVNGSRGSGGSSGASGAWSEGSSAGASLQSDDDADTQNFLDQLCAMKTPQVNDMTPTSALVQWNSPLPEGIPLPPVDLTYDLLLGDRGRYKAIYSGPKLSCRVCDLRPGCEYSVRLQIRAGDAGATSEETRFRAPAAPPAPPAAPRVTQRTRTSLLLRWQAAADHGARVTHYLLELDGGDGWLEVARPRTRQHTANELKPQTRYRFRLAAVNECGRGDWSEETVVWTAGAPPAAPRAPRLLEATRTSLALGWERRTPDEEFTLQLNDRHAGHGFLPVYSGPDERHVCMGLRRATDYKFRLRCETADGQGPWSTEVSYRTQPESPAPPGRPAARGKIHSRAFRLRWEPPLDDGGAPLERYTLELDAGDGYREAYSGTDREAHCDRLLPGTAYSARVRCATAAGESDWSPAETVTTEAACPGQCATPEPAGPPRALSAAIKWRPPDSYGGSPLTEYRVELADDEGTRLAYSGLDLECLVRDLTPGAHYRLTVTACNRVGAGPPSAPLAFSAAPAPPSAPPCPRVHLEGRTVRLEWDEPHENGAPLTEYRLEMSTANVEAFFSQVYRGIDRSHVLENLVPFSAYFFRVCGCNSAGRGAWSPARDVLTPRAPPAAPAAPHYESDADALRLEWSAPADHGAEIIRYRLRVDEQELETDDATPARLVGDLQPDTTYRVRVAAVSELGLGDWSETTRAVTRPPPPDPPQLECVLRTHNYLKIKWGDGASDSMQYRLEMRGPTSREFAPVYRGSARSCKVKKLRESTSYTFRIRASEERSGRGPWSAPLEAATLGAPPAAPRVPSLDWAGPRCAAVRWEAAADCTYSVGVSRGGGPWRTAWEGPGDHCALEDLEPGVEYSVRVAAARGGQAGAWSAPARAWCPAAAVAAPRAARAPRTRAPRRLAARHTALLMAAAFLVLAVVVAVVVQRLVEPSP